jgi:hypothetical protein
MYQHAKLYRELDEIRREYKVTIFGNSRRSVNKKCVNTRATSHFQPLYTIPYHTYHIIVFFTPVFSNTNIDHTAELHRSHLELNTEAGPEPKSSRIESA